MVDIQPYHILYVLRARARRQAQCLNHYATPVHVPNVTKIWEPKPPGTVWATPGLLYLNIYILYFMRIPNSVEIWQKYGEIYRTMQVCLVPVQSQKAPISSAISICQSVHTVQLPMDKFLWSFYIRDFYQNSKFSENKTKVWETLHNDAKYVLLLPAK